MFGQTYSTSDLPTIGALIFLEGLLSADNAMVLAIMVRHLPPALQKKALLYGLGGAFVLRSALIALATVIIQFWWLQLAGGLYLVWLPVKHFWMHSRDTVSEPKGMGFWPTVIKVEIMDLAFALDSVLAGVAVVDTARHPDKTWVVIAGGVIGVIILRFAAGAFIRLLNRYPLMDHVAYLLVGWAGIKMFSVAGHTFDKWWATRNSAPPPIIVPEMTDTIFWIGMILIFGIGAFLAWKKGPTESEEGESTAEAMEDVADLSIDNPPQKQD